jgi:putative tryptophan/tyrosine transport system substrate-binding protein
MRRREFIAGLGAAAAALPLTARGQTRVRVVGFLTPYPEDDENARARFHVFRQELARLGWSEGRDVQLDVRWTTDNMDRVRAEAANLVQTKPDVIACNGDRVVAVLRQLTNSIPIVATASELAGSGFVESLARPGANVTGFSVIEFSVIGKMVDTLRQLAPGVSRVGMIYNPDNPVGAVYGRAFDAVTAQLGLQPIVFPVHGVADIERAIANLAGHPNGGLVVPPDVTVIALATQVTSLAARYRVPAIYSAPFYVRPGGLASYGPDLADIVRRQASYVDRILRGEKASNLPIQQPTSYQLVINLKTAKTLGLTIPETLLATADEVIQ